MNTPDPLSLATIQQAIGTGALVVGGGDSGNWGQGITEGFVNNMVVGASSFLSGGINTIEGALAGLRDFLHTLPLDALKRMEAFIPGLDPTAFSDIPKAVETILSKVLLTPYQWLVTAINQIIAIFNGELVTPISEGVQGVKDWFISVATQLTTVIGQWRLLIDTGVNALTNGTGVGHELKDFENALKNILPGNILGTGGHSTLEDTIQSIRDHLVGGLLGRSVTGSSDADVFNAAQLAASNVDGSDVTVYVAEAQIITRPSWAVYGDFIPLGPGQGGEIGGPVPGFYGQGGAPGKFNPTTLQHGVHFGDADVEVHFTPGAPGAKNGGVGTPTVFTFAGHTISAAAGSGPESPQIGGHTRGVGPSLLNYNGKPYQGGGDQNGYGKPGAGPGAGGAGGSWIGLLTFQDGGPGGPGVGWVRWRKDAVPGQVFGADVTPPTPPTNVDIQSTFSTLTITPSGATDD